MAVAMAMASKQYYIMLIKKAQNLKDTQFIGKQSPRVHFSVGKSVSERATSSIQEKAGCNCVWDETIYVEIRNEVEFLVVEVKNGTTLIGIGRIAASNVSEFPYTQDLQLTDQTGNKAGRLTCTVQRFVGDLNQLHAQAHALKYGQGQARAAPAANVFLNSINRPPVSVPGGFQPPPSHTGVMPLPPHHPHPMPHSQSLPGGFSQPASHLSGNQHHQGANIGGFHEVSGRAQQQPQPGVRPVSITLPSRPVSTTLPPNTHTRPVSIAIPHTSGLKLLAIPNLFCYIFVRTAYMCV